MAERDKSRRQFTAGVGAGAGAGAAIGSAAGTALGNTIKDRQHDKFLRAESARTGFPTARIPRPVMRGAGKKAAVAGLGMGGATAAMGNVAHRMKHPKQKVKKNMSVSAFGVDHGEFSKSNPWILGAPQAAALDAPKGKKKKAYKDSMVSQYKKLGAGTGIGAGVGAAAGAAASRGNRAGGAKLGALGGAGVGGFAAAAGGHGHSYRQAKKKGGW